MPDTDTIWVHSHVSAKTGAPYVVLSWGKNQAQMTPTEAKVHALGIIEAADAAISDAAVAVVLGGMGPKTVALLVAMRGVRASADKFNAYKAGHPAPPTEPRP